MKRYLFLCTLAVAAVAAHAQFKLPLQGLDDLTIELNDVNHTATICCYNAEIQDGKKNVFGVIKMDVKWRWVEWYIKNAPETLIIPSSWTHPHTNVKYTITAIGDAAFAGVKKVSTVVIPSTVTDIGRYAFFGSSLESINIPPSVKIIGDRAFGFCTSLKSLRIPQNVVMGDNLYAESPKLKVVQYNTGVDDLASNNSRKNMEKKGAIAPVINSDVDVNIPNLGQHNEETFAMIIANEIYNDGVPPVQYAIHDGKVFKEYCEKVLGLNPKHIYYEENATQGTMNGLMDRLITAAEAFEGDAKFIVYYAGHGIPDETTSEAYLLPTDGNGLNLKSAFRLRDFYDALGKLNAKSVTVFLDACFSGAQRGEGMLMAARGVAIKPQEEAPKLGNTVVFSAASGNETAWPYKEKCHGLFTYYLLKKLRESNGEATLGEIDAYIQKQVKRSIVDMPYAKKQTPVTDPSPRLFNTWQDMKLK